ncbi:hypothetical protein ASPWEDRAFT_109272 [Aspergillus wentii DTO 134E9]|uniref:Uncharacterized protein n=1 Tax=Aspergillus wentii DTO 134E9 TaxID=1073089 RepID=A0A1L9RP21_ASPWE|nr:uncharacterized protein ASPWEDRAFT_109272 [Aspergillus wentii DTO 134E9]KAI9934171.1 hypothetical protein MW887_005244 [Aspergillus wentii]OJJ36689.1 hypothetical protein ASPWEDRAFT_109272 [Aspergillus wentii DTO 134E9]
MGSWQHNTRTMHLMHQIGEFLDLDSTSNLAELSALIDAMREGLTQVDEGLQIPDAQINMLFLSKLKARPEWNDWATAMLRDPRVSTFSMTDGTMTFKELARLAIDQEIFIRTQKSKGAIKHASSEPFPLAKGEPIDTRGHTQDEINAFVVEKMSQDAKFRPHGVRGHSKKPSQEEINEYVVQKMRREQEKKTRNRSQSQPEPRALNHQRHQRQKSTQAHCSFCGASYHPSSNCWRRWRVAAETPHANFLPKRVEYRTEIPGQPPMYRTGFSLY